jgi:uncharacterized delta-60 repeat protein
MTRQSDGKILIGGIFTEYNGVQRNGIARINFDGTLDETFNPGSGFLNNNLNIEMAIQTDGKIIVGGNFYYYDGIVCYNIVRLNTNGSIDPSFQSGSGASAYLTSVAVKSNGKIIIAGELSVYDGIVVGNIAQLNSNGTLDNTFQSALGFNGSVEEIAIQADGKVIIAHNNSSVESDLLRLNLDGSIDQSFISGLVDQEPYKIKTISIQANNKIIVGGSFTVYNNLPASGLIRLNSNGTPENPSFDVDNIYSETYSTVIQDDGKIIAAGWFGVYTDTPLSRRNVVRINADGSMDDSFNALTGANNDVYATAIQQDGKIIVGGAFTRFNSNKPSYLIRLNEDGSVDTSFNNGGPGPNSWVTSITLQSDDKIIIGGWFQTYNGVTQRRIARLNSDGTLDGTFNSGITGTAQVVYSTALQADGKLIIAGRFTEYNTIARKNIARLNQDGSLDASFNPGSGANEIIYNTLVQNDGKILISGNFTEYNGNPRNYIARLNSNGSIDPTFNIGLGANDIIWSMAIQSDNKIIIGGEFTTYNENTSNYLARLNANGSFDNLFNENEVGPNSDVYSLAIQTDGKIILGGWFSAYNNISINKIARLNSDGTLDQTFNPGAGLNSSVFSVAFQSDNKIVIGGRFSSYDLIGRNRIARIINCVNSATVLNVTSCNSFTAPDGRVYSNSGIKTAVIQTPGGCDSTITINLTINKIESSLTINGQILTSNALNCKYQWVDCDNDFSPLQNETNQSLIAQRNGRYAVIAAKEGCVDTSECVLINLLGKVDLVSGDAIVAYINSINKDLVMRIPGNRNTLPFFIYNISGQRVYSGYIIEEKILDTGQFKPGLYFLHFYSNGIHKTQKLFFN